MIWMCINIVMTLFTGQKFVCDIEGCGKMYTTPISLRGHKAQHAGFSKTCHYCFKTYKNPYGHKCKASRDNKRKIAKQGNKISICHIFYFTTTKLQIDSASKKKKKIIFHKLSVQCSVKIHWFSGGFWMTWLSKYLLDLHILVPCCHLVAFM